MALPAKRFKGKAGFERLLLDQSPDALIATTTEGNVLYWSKGAEAIFGYSSAEAVGRSVQEIVVPDDRAEQERAVLNEALETGFSTYESVRRRKDGSLVYVDISCRMVRDAKGDIDYVLLTKKDVTRLKVMHDGKLVETRFRDLLESMGRRVADSTIELRESQEQLRAATETANDAIVSADGNGNIINFNHAASDLFGYSRDEAIGRSITMLMPRRLREAHRSEIARYLSAGEARVIGHTTVLTGLRKDGSEFPLELSLATWKSRGMAFFTGIIRDITDRNRDAAALQVASRELEAFSYSVSHDLRAPLHAMQGYAEALQESLDGQLGEKERHYLERIRSAGASMDRLIDDLLSLSGISRVDLVATEVDLSAMATDLLSELRASDPSRRSRIVVRPGMWAHGDAGLLRIALTNLLANAWKFSAGREITDIEVGPFAEGDATNGFFVRDRGAGFDPAYAKKLFGTFQRLHSQAEFPGSGIGLATVQRVIERHGGTVRAEGAVDQGATFYFSLPAKAGPPLIP